MFSHQDKYMHADADSEVQHLKTAGRAAGGMRGGEVSGHQTSKLTANAHFDLLYSNSMCRQSSMPTSILMELLASG